MDIMLEVTRKCNLRCEHCVRGPAQNKSISDRVLNEIGKLDIGTLTLTGGEPTLVKDLIPRLRRYNIYPDDVWTCTNGKVYKEAWAKEYLEYVSQLQYRDISGLSVSTDLYHPGISKHNLKKYQALAELYENISVASHNDHMTYDKIRVEGNGANLSGIETCDRCCEWKQKEINGDPLYEGYGSRTIYITVDGDVLYGGMWSYKRMSNLILGNITEHSLWHILSSVENKYRKRYARITKLNHDDVKWKRRVKHVAT